MADGGTRHSNRWSCGPAAGRADLSRTGALVIRLAGELDLSNAAALAGWLAGLAADEIVLDLTDVRYLAACGAREVGAFVTLVTARGARLRVVEPAEPLVRQVLSLAGALVPDPSGGAPP
jgi:anti-anti-sigma factor